MSEEEEEVHKNTESWYGLDDEIYTAPSLERLRDIPMFSPQRAFTGWCADQVLSPPVDLFAFQREWASIPMYLPQRSPTGRCADQEQSPEDKMHLIILSIRRCRIYGIVSVQMSAEDMMHLNSLEIGNSKIYGDVSFQIYSTQRSPTSWCAEQEQSPEDKMHSNSLKIRRSTIYSSVSFQTYMPRRLSTGWCTDQEQSQEDKMHSISLKIGRSTIYGIVSVQMSAEDMMHSNSLEIGNSKIYGDVSFQIYLTQISPTSWCAEQEQSLEDNMHSNSLKIRRSTIYGDVSFHIYSTQRSPTSWCAEQEQSPEDKMHSNSLKIGRSTIYGHVSFHIYSTQISPTSLCAKQEQSPKDKMHSISLEIVHSIIHGSVSLHMYSRQSSSTGSCTNQKQWLEDKMHSNRLTIRKSNIHGIVSFPMYLPQRSPIGWCAHQEQSPEVGGVSIGNTFVTGWNGDGCSLIEPKLLNNSLHQNSPGSQPPEVVRPLQQRNDGVVIRDDNDEQNVNLIPINEVRPLQQRNDGVVIRDDNNEENVNLLPSNEVQPLQDMNIGVVFGNELDQNVIHIHEETKRIEAMARKRKATYVGEGNENSQETERIEAMARKRKATYVGEGNENSQVRPLQQRNDGVLMREDTDEQNVNLIPINEVQPLQEINIGVVFGNELNQNVIPIHDETETIEAMARKRKATYVQPLQQRNDGVVVCDDTDEQNVNLIPINEVQCLQDFGNELDQNVIHIHEVRPLQQRNDGVLMREDTDERNVNLIPINEVQPLREINIGVVFRNELDQNVIPIHEETETIEAMARKHKATYVGEGNENSQVRPLRQRNDGVVIRDDTDERNSNLIPINEVQRLQDFGNELNQNVIHFHEETERIEAMARKGKATHVGEGNKNSQGYSLEGRHVEVNSLMDEKLYSGVKDIQFQASWPEVEIMQEDSSEQQIMGELGPKNIGNKAVQKKEKGHSKKNIGHKVASAEKSCKKKRITETPTKKYWTKCFISKEDLLEHVGLKREDAAEALGVSVSTFKRRCRKYGITCWNGDGCPRPRVEPELLNNAVHQSSPGSIPAEIRGEKETSALLRAKQDDVTIKANYGESILKFQLSSKSGVRELNKEVAKRSLLELGSFKVEYLDEDEEPILIACDEDFQACVEFFSRSSSNEVIRLLVNKVSNSEKSHQSCSGLKRKEVSASSSRAACTLRGEGEEVDYIQYLPEPFQRYMSHTKNVKDDGHCGFRVIAAQIYDTEEDWAKVRHDLIHEIRRNKDLYDVLYPEHNWADKLLQSLSYFLPTAPKPNWMDCMSLGVVIASRYNIVLYTFDANVGCCYTHLPLRSPPVPVKQRKEIAIARINDHFVQLFLHPHHPVPPVPIWWWERASDEAKGWASSYDFTL